MKVIHISRKAKIKRTSYEWYRAKNKLKSKYHKVGAFATALVLAGFLAAIPVFGPVLAILSMFASYLAITGKIRLAYGIFAVLTFNCNYGLSNTGTDCTPTMTAAKKLILVPYINAANGINRFALSNPGTIACTATSATLTGTGTTFLTTFTIGDIVVITGNTQVFQILSIASNTSMTATVVAAASSSTTTYNNFTNIAYWNALVAHPDPTRRWYPVPFMKNADNTRQDPTMEQFDDGTEQETIQGVRKFSGIIPKANASPQLQGKLLAMKNTDFGMYWIDYTNNMVGTDPLDGFFYPIRIDQNSWVPIFNPGTAKKGMKIDLKFDVHTNEIDSNLNAIAASNFGSAILGNLNGLKDASVVYSNIVAANNNLTMALTTLYGDSVTKTQVHGLNVNSFYSTNTGALGKIYDKTAAADKTITSVTEGTDINGKFNGVYTIVLSVAGSAADVLQPAISAPGYDFSAVNVSPVTLT